MGSGSAFSSIGTPNVVVQVGTAGSTGVAEISSMLFGTRAPGTCSPCISKLILLSDTFPAGGAIVVEWNVHDPAGNQGAAGMWDTLLRFGGSAGSNMQTTQCSNNLGVNTGTACQSAFLGLHITSQASAYLEGTWVWNADHDIEPGGTNVTLFSGRGILSQSQGPVWMVGTGASTVACWHSFH
jgi:glucan 1,3-beta-glucosidase